MTVEQFNELEKKILGSFGDTHSTFEDSVSVSDTIEALILIHKNKNLLCGGLAELDSKETLKKLLVEILTEETESTKDGSIYDSDKLEVRRL